MTAMSWSSTTWLGRMPAVADLVWMTSTSCPRMMKDGRVKVVGRNCVAPDRPGIQYVVHSLAGFMKEPTKAEQRLCLYFKGPATKELVWWRWIRNQHAECWPPSERGGAVDTSCDADHAGNRATRKSISSVQIYLDGNLMESYVRGWREECKLVCMPDSSAAGSLATRLGILDVPATLKPTCCGYRTEPSRFWHQEFVKSKSPSLEVYHQDLTALELKGTSMRSWRWKSRRGKTCENLPRRQALRDRDGHCFVIDAAIRSKKILEDGLAVVCISGFPHSDDEPITFAHWFDCNLRSLESGYGAWISMEEGDWAWPHFVGQASEEKQQRSEEAVWRCTATLRFEVEMRKKMLEKMENWKLTRRQTCLES